MLRIPFVKMHGLGNDFVVIDDVTSEKRADETPITPEIARLLAHRNLGVGADQILWLKPAQGPSAAFRMEILNADGSSAEMCGNGIRAAALLWRRRGGGDGARIQVETVSGNVKIDWVLDDVFRVAMGVPEFGPGGPAGEELEVGGQRFRFVEVDMGNPHAVIFVANVASVQLEAWGPLIEKHPRFPNRTNVEFVQVLSPKQVDVRVWERGAGATLACGSGACAVAAAVLASGQGQSPIEVKLPGGILELSWKGRLEPIQMMGPATWVFEGVFEGEG